MLGAAIETAKESVGSIMVTFIADPSIVGILEHTVGEPEAKGVEVAPRVALPGIVATGITTLDAPEANTTRTTRMTGADLLDMGAEVMLGPGHVTGTMELELPPTIDIATVQLRVTPVGETPVLGGGGKDATIEDSAAAIGGENVVVREIGVAGVGTLVATGACMPIVVTRPLAGEGWARDAHMVEGIFRIVEGMAPPWVTIDVLEAAALQFPTVDRETLRLVIMTVMMTQRRGVVRLTRAGLRLGPRVDRNGNALVELDLDFADRYSNSH